MDEIEVKSHVGGLVNIVRSIIVVAKLAESFGGAAIPKVLATFATTKSDSYFSDDAKRGETSFDFVPR